MQMMKGMMGIPGVAGDSGAQLNHTHEWLEEEDDSNQEVDQLMLKTVKQRTKYLSEIIKIE